MQSQMEVQRENRREHLAQLLAWCDDRLRTHPADVESLLKISGALWDMGQRVAALEYSRKILTHHPGHAEVREAIQRYTEELGGAGRAIRSSPEERSQT
ncbi:MAG: hypothetical protein HY549_01590 [Elusimicrobia bacterium]|nr:hypothetical protein [Elusimicrobiota bacterium]